VSGIVVRIVLTLAAKRDSVNGTLVAAFTGDTSQLDAVAERQAQGNVDANPLYAPASMEANPLHAPLK
jgi:hypothetical protein